MGGAHRITLLRKPSLPKTNTYQQTEGKNEDSSSLQPQNMEELAIFFTCFIIFLYQKHALYRDAATHNKKTNKQTFTSNRIPDETKLARLA